MKKILRKLLLVKEIISKQGIIHFRRYRLLQTPLFSIYIHQICQSDTDDMHDHPWHFLSIILKGGYREISRSFPYFKDLKVVDYYPGDVIVHHLNDVHKISLLNKSVWTLVFVFGRKKYWGYRLKDGISIGHEEYRSLKNKGKLK